jgi:CHAT domain-containing protein/lipopolysaccharide biosynthesis regulator YciM
MRTTKFYQPLLSLTASLFLCIQSINAQIDTSLFNAIKNCDIQKIESIKSGIDINAVDSNGANALMWAAFYCDVPMVKYLISLGVKIPEKAVIYPEDRPDNKTNLYSYGSIQCIAAGGGNLDLLQYLSDTLGLPLHESSYNVYTKLNDGLSPLSWSIGNVHLQIIEYLLKKYKKKLATKVDQLIQALKEFSSRDVLKLTIDEKIQLWQLFLEIAKEYFGEDHINYARTLFQVGNFYIDAGIYTNAVTLYEQGLSIFGKKQTETLEYAAYLNNLGYLNFRQSRFDKSLALCEKALIIYKRILGEEHSLYTQQLSNIAVIYLQIDEYDKALPIYQQALAIFKKKFGEESAIYAMKLSELGELYDRMGLYQKALPILQKAVELNKKVAGEESLNYVWALTYLGNVYRYMRDYEKAISVYEQVLAIKEKLLGKEHPEYVISLNDLVSGYINLRDFTKALALLQQEGDIINKRFGKDHPAYELHVARLGWCFYDMQQYEKAIPFFEEQLAIQKKKYAEDHPASVGVLNDLAFSYANTNRMNEAFPLLTKACTINLKYLERQYSILSEKEKINLAYENSQKFDFFSSIVFRNNITYPAALIQLYNNELLRKGGALQNQMDVLRSIRLSGDTTILHLYDAWKTNNQNIARQMSRPIKSRTPYLDSLKEVNNEYEQILSRSSTVFRNGWRFNTLNTANISKSLASHEAAIEFHRFRVYHGKEISDSAMYAATIILPNDSVPHIVYLFEEKQLKKLLQPAVIKKSSYVAVQNLYSSSPSNNPLYNLIWKPLEKYLKQTTTVYFAPSRLLHRISFAALPIDGRKTLADKYQLNQMLSTRSILNPFNAQKPQTASLWGNIWYESDISIASRSLTRSSDDDSALSSFNLYTFDTRNNRGDGWRPLPATKLEVDSIKKLFNKAVVNTSIFMEQSAAEEDFKALSGNSPQVLHLATHGFFLPVPDKKDDEDASNAFTVQENPMFRSGLVLAGGNQTWKGGVPDEGKEDGILTAFEIAQMDLSNTNLVVLSACETALGDIQGNEGVIGLQRALKMAGVKQMMLSLWKVPDKPTMELITSFYKYWLNGQSPRQALRSAQLQLKKKYPSPYFWGGFVLVE